MKERRKYTKLNENGNEIIIFRYSAWKCSFIPKISELNSGVIIYGKKVRKDNYSKELSLLFMFAETSEASEDSSSQSFMQHLFHPHSFEFRFVRLFFLLLIKTFNHTKKGKTKVESQIFLFAIHEIISFVYFFACAWKFVSWEFCKLENVICWEVRSEMRKKGWRIWWNSKFYGNIQTSCTSQKCWNFPKISSGWRFYEVKRSDEFPVLLKYVVLSEKSMLRVEKFKIPLVSNSSISWKHEK